MKVSCFINQVIDYHANLVELFVTQERNFPFSSITRNSECCAVVLFMSASLRLHIWQFFHINMGNGDKDNLILSFLIKVNKLTWLNIQNL